MEQDAQYVVVSTVRCVFKRVLPNAQFVANVIGNAATRTSFLHLEPAENSEGSIKCSDVVSDAFFVLQLRGEAVLRCVPWPRLLRVC